MINTATLRGNATSHDITTALAAGSLTVTQAVVYKFGTETVVQLTYSNASIGYLKFKATGQFKVAIAVNVSLRTLLKF